MSNLVSVTQVQQISINIHTIETEIGTEHLRNNKTTHHCERKGNKQVPRLYC